MSNRVVCMIAAGMCLAVGLAAAPAYADLTLSTHFTIDSPQIRAKMASIPPQYQALVQKFTDMTETTSISGKKMRMDMPMMSTIADSGAGKMYMLNMESKTYSVDTLDPAQMSQTLLNPGAKNGKVSDYSVQDTGKEQILIGHKTHEYIVTTKYVDTENKPITMTADIWAAQDITGPDADGYNVFQSATPGTTHVTGIPLLMTATMTGGASDGTVVKQEVTSIATDPLPSSTFTVPSDFTLVNQLSAPTFGGGPPGHGMGGPPPGM